MDFPLTVPSLFLLCPGSTSFPRCPPFFPARFLPCSHIAGSCFQEPEQKKSSEREKVITNPLANGIFGRRKEEEREVKENGLLIAMSDGLRGIKTADPLFSSLFKSACCRLPDTLLMPSSPSIRVYSSTPKVLQ